MQRGIMQFIGIAARGARRARHVIAGRGILAALRRLRVITRVVRLDFLPKARCLLRAFETGSGDCDAFVRSRHVARWRALHPSWFRLLARLSARFPVRIHVSQ